MTELEKFLFDFDFDDVKLMEEIVQEEAVEEGVLPEEPEEPEEPTFSQEELDAARQEGYSRGKSDGMKEALGGIENDLVGVVNQLNRQVDEIHQIQAANLEEFHRETATLALAICRKLFPVMNQHGGFEEVAHAAEKIMTSLLHESQLSVRVQEEFAGPLKERIEAQLRQNGYRGELSVEADSGLQNGELRIDWQSGYAKRNPKELLEEISDIIDKRVEFGAEALPAQDAPAEPAEENELMAPEETGVADTDLPAETSDEAEAGKND